MTISAQNVQIAELSSKIYDAAISHQVDLLRLEARADLEIRFAFKELADELARLIISIDPTKPIRTKTKQARLIKLIGGSEKVINEIYTKINKGLRDDFLQLAQIEQEATLEIINSQFSISLADKRLSKEMLSSIASNTLVQGAVMGDWWKSLGEGFAFKFAAEMRKGLLAGENLNELVKRVHGEKTLLGYLGLNDARKVVRTGIASVANKARMEVLQNNSDVIKGYEWISTLDERTTEICMALDGCQWDLKGKIISGKVKFPGPPPAHWQCRSSMIPILKSFEDLIIDPKKRAKLKESGETFYESETRSAKFGPVSGRWTFDDWLKNQDQAYQREILGATKYRLWNEGKITSVKQLIDQSHRPLTVKELLAKYD